MRSYAELHVHIEGALEPETAFALSEKNKVELPYADAGELRSHFTFATPAAYRELYRANRAVLVTEDDFARVGDEYFTKAKASGVVRAEVSCDLAAHLARGVAAEAVLDGLSASMARAEKDLGISAGLVLNFDEDAPIEQAEDAYDRAIASGVELAAVGLCLFQGDTTAAKFGPLFGRARAEGLHTVANVGGEAGNDRAWECLRSLRVGRIGACTIEDRNLMYYLADYGIPLTISPLANAGLHHGEGAIHPIPQLLSEGVVVTINSEAPAYFGGYLDANVAAVTSDFALSDRQLDTLARNSIQGAFLPQARKLELIGELVPA